MLRVSPKIQGLFREYLTSEGWKVLSIGERGFTRNAAGLAELLCKAGYWGAVISKLQGAGLSV